VRASGSVCACQRIGQAAGESNRRQHPCRGEIPLSQPRHSSRRPLDWARSRKIIFRATYERRRSSNPQWPNPESRTTLQASTRHGRLWRQVTCGVPAPQVRIPDSGLRMPAATQERRGKSKGRGNRQDRSPNRLSDFVLSPFLSLLGPLSFSLHTWHLSRYGWGWLFGRWTATLQP
jgi:hypothetical protein